MTLKISIVARLGGEEGDGPFKSRRVLEKKVNRAGFRAIRASREFLDLFQGADGKKMFTNDSERRAYTKMVKI